MAEYMTLEVHINSDSSESKMGKGNRKVKAKSETHRMKELSKSLTLATGFVATSLSIANSAVGSYTGNKLRQANNQAMINMVSTGVGLLVSIATQNYVGAVAIAIGATTSAIRSTSNFFIESVNSRQESAYRMAYKGNPTTSGSRFRGEKR